MKNIFNTGSTGSVRVFYLKMSMSAFTKGEVQWSVKDFLCARGHLAENVRKGKESVTKHRLGEMEKTFMRVSPEFGTLKPGSFMRSQGPDFKLARL